MKLLSELGACWSSATTTPPQTETTGDLPPPETAGSRNRVANRYELRREIRSINNAGNWKPQLHAICEESACVFSDSNLLVRNSDKRSLVKTKANYVKPKVSTTSKLGDNFRRSYQIAMNAFAPTPFLL